MTKGVEFTITWHPESLAISPADFLSSEATPVEFSHYSFSLYPVSKNSCTRDLNA